MSVWLEVLMGSEASLAKPGTPAPQPSQPSQPTVPLIFRIAKASFFLQNLAASLLSRISPTVEHNLGKYKAIRKAFFLTALEQIDGDYLEFGVFTGSSFTFACKFGEKLSKQIGSRPRFFGFDSFEGFGEVAEEDKHPFYINDIFEVNFDRVRKNIARQAGSARFELIKGFFDKTLRGKKPSDYGIQKARIVFIDCDLKIPARDVLDFVRPILQPGTILIFDDFYSYKGDPGLGLAGAFNEFSKDCQEFKFRQLDHYGLLGVAYICYRSSNS